MAEPDPHQHGASSPTPSLIDRLRPRRSGGDWRWAGPVRYAAGLVLIALAIVAVVASLLAHRARREALALGDTVARVSAAREGDHAAAAVFGTATLGEELAGIAAHLPPDTRLALAARSSDGALTIAIDAADPDALRATLRADRWFAAFRERGQAMGENGAIRVTFERMP